MQHAPLVGRLPNAELAVRAHDVRDTHSDDTRQLGNGMCPERSGVALGVPTTQSQREP